jgi:DNA polymerase III delta prime subunit
MEISFIQKYIPRHFNDFYVEPKFCEFLYFLTESNNINTIFIGTPESGKTSLLNVIIQQYYKGIEQKLIKQNIMYLNNSKDQGIHFYRNEVKTFCQTCSLIPNKKKFIVIDDIDYINEQSQQAFRNIIDKYSHNIHFICSCTNIQKVIESLQSRLIILKMRKVDNTILNNILNKIIITEKISMDDKSKELLINLSNNSIRIMINYLEKFKLLNIHIDYDLVNKLCTDIHFNTFDNYLQFIQNKDLLKSTNILLELFDKGYSVMDILNSLFLYLKLDYQLDENIKYKLITYLCKYIHIFHDIHEDEVELSLFTNNIYKLLHF